MFKREKIDGYWFRAKAPELLLCGLIVLYLHSVSDRAFSDFWADEIYTLKHFVLVPLSVTISDYHVPNNHVLFSLLLNAWTSLLGQDTLRDVFVSPFSVRLLPLTFSLSSIYLVYRIGEEIGDRWLGIIAASLLVCSLSFFEFGIQLRGYSLSICLVAAMILESFKMMRKPKIVPFFRTVFLTIMLAYTIPSNYYFLLGLFFAAVGMGLWDYSRERRGNNCIHSERKGDALLAVAVALGVAVSLVLYLPILQEVFFNEYVEKIGVDFARAVKMFYLVNTAFLSRRTGILVLALVGVFWLLREKRFSTECKGLVYLGAVFILPFIISGIRGDNPPPRAFAVLVPIFSIGVGWLIYLVFQKIGLMRLAVGVFCLIGALEFHYERGRLESVINHNLEKTRGPSRAQELNYGYYSYGYQPLTDIRVFNGLRIGGKPLIIGDAEPNGLSEYLDAMGVDHILTDLRIPDVDGGPWVEPRLRELAKKYPNGFYFVTRFHNRLYRSLIEEAVPARVTAISPQVSYHNFFHVEPI